MTLIRFDSVSLELGGQRLLREANLSIEPNERVCLIGRNGAGKSSLFKLINSELTPDQGEIQYRQGLRISKLEQTLPSVQQSTVREVVTEGLQILQTMIDQFHHLSKQSNSKKTLQELAILQNNIESHGGWHIDQQVEKIMTDLQLPGERTLAELSGGWQRRVLLGRALVSKPDLLLLDEPTNHLDISTIEWLEHQVRGYPGSVLFITHDRTFLQKLATRILELDLANLTSWPGDFKNFLEKKAQAIEAESRQNSLFDKKLAQEEAWLRQGIKARRTRNEGRVRALHAMRKQAAQREKRDGHARIHVTEAERSGRKVIEARNISHSYNNEALIKNFFN